MRKLRIGCINAQYMRNICARFSPNPHDLRKIVLISPMRNICARFAQDCTYFLQCTLYAQDLWKIVLLSPMCNICARFAQDSTYFSNAQYMRKICARLYFFPQCAMYAQDLRKIVLFSPMRKIVLISPMRKSILIPPMCNICARFVQDCTSFPNAQYMRKICARLYLTSNLKC